MNQQAAVEALLTLLGQNAAKAKTPYKVKPRGQNGGKAKLSKEDFELALIEACKKLGYLAPEPRFNILTYDRWVEKGRKVKKGEHGIKVAGRKTRLFHEAQTEAILQA